MNKTWAEIKSEVINLGFEKTKAFTKYSKSFFEAFNWAQTYIATTFAPIYEEVLFTSNTDDKVLYTDIASDMYKLLGVYKTDRTPTQYATAKDGIWFMEDGEYIICYNRFPQKLESDDGNHELEIDYEYAVLMPYLMAHRLWLDDDMSKAVLYWNTFEDMKNQLQVSNPNISVSKGWI